MSIMKAMQCSVQVGSVIMLLPSRHSQNILISLNLSNPFHDISWISLKPLVIRPCNRYDVHQPYMRRFHFVFLVHLFALLALTSYLPSSLFVLVLGKCSACLWVCWNILNRRHWSTISVVSVIINKRALNVTEIVIIGTYLRMKQLAK